VKSSTGGVKKAGDQFSAAASKAGWRQAQQPEYSGSTQTKQQKGRYAAAGVIACCSSRCWQLLVPVQHGYQQALATAYVVSDGSHMEQDQRQQNPFAKLRMVLAAQRNCSIRDKVRQRAGSGNFVITDQPGGYL
jgi:hypothetical protein